MKVGAAVGNETYEGPIFSLSWIAPIKHIRFGNSIAPNRTTSVGVALVLSRIFNQKQISYSVITTVSMIIEVARILYGNLDPIL